MIFYRPIATLVTAATLLVLVACSDGNVAIESTLAAQVDSPLSAPISPLAATDTYAPEAGNSAIAGRLIDIATGSPMANQNLSLPAVLCAPGVAEEDKREQCFYMIDEAFDPSALTDGDGNFVFEDIPAGEYVLLVGNLMSENAVLKDELNRPIIWRAVADTVVELGDLVVEFQ